MDYILKFSFSTVRVNKNSSITGSNGTAETLISTELVIDELLTRKDDLLAIAYNSLVEKFPSRGAGYISEIKDLQLQDMPEKKCTYNIK